MTNAGAMRAKPPIDAGERARQARNLRTGLILGSIALAFFLGFLLRRMYQ